MLPPGEPIPRAQRVEMIVGQLDQMIERDALYEAPEAIAAGRADGIIDGLPNLEFGFRRVDFRRQGCRCAARLVVSHQRGGKRAGSLVQVPDFRRQRSNGDGQRLHVDCLVELFKSPTQVVLPRQDRGAGIVHGPIDLLNSRPQRSAHGWISGNERGNLIKRPRNALTGRVECLFG